MRIAGEQQPVGVWQRHELVHDDDNDVDSHVFHVDDQQQRGGS